MTHTQVTRDTPIILFAHTNTVSEVYISACAHCVTHIPQAQDRARAEGASRDGQRHDSRGEGILWDYVLSLATSSGANF